MLGSNLKVHEKVKKPANCEKATGFRGQEVTGGTF